MAARHRLNHGFVARILMAIMMSLLFDTMRITSNNNVQFFVYAATATSGKMDGLSHYNKATKLYNEEKYDDAAEEYWQAFVKHKKKAQGRTFSASEAYQKFLMCYMKQNKLGDGLAFIAYDSFQRGKKDTGLDVYEQAVVVDPKNPMLQKIRVEFGDLLTNRSNELLDDNLVDIASDDFDVGEESDQPMITLDDGLNTPTTTDEL